MMDLAKRLAARLPLNVQHNLRSIQHGRQLRRGEFVTDEPEFEMLAQWVSEGDWVLDIGANIGHYSVRLSELVGCSGRVLAFEPVLATFQLLVSNLRRMSHMSHNNVTALNVACSDTTRLTGSLLSKICG